MVLFFSCNQGDIIQHPNRCCVIVMFRLNVDICIAIVCMFSSSSSVLSFTQFSPTCGYMPLATLSLWPGRQPYRPRLVDGRRGGEPSSELPAVAIHRLGFVGISPSPHHCFRTAHSCAQPVESLPTKPVLSKFNRQRLGHPQSHFDRGWHICMFCNKCTRTHVAIIITMVVLQTVLCLFFTLYSTRAWTPQCHFMASTHCMPIDIIPSATNLEHYFTQSSSLLHSASSCHTNLHFLITSPVASTPVLHHTFMLIILISVIFNFA